jgi:ribonuclease P protein component
MTDLHFPKRMRLLRAGEFDQVFAARATASDARLVVHGTLNGLSYPRLGVAVSRRIGTAVARNRWKRLIREAFRQAQRQLPALDIVCVPRPGLEPRLEKLLESLPVLARRIESQLQQRAAGSKPRPQATGNR